MQNKSTLFLALCTGVFLVHSPSVIADTAGNAEAMAEGKSFAASMKPLNLTTPTAASGNPNASSPSNAPTNTPGYTTSQPNSSMFKSGVTIVSQGSTAINNCKSYVPTGDAVADQECAGVNFLANNPAQSQFVIQPNDPALIAFKQAAAGAVTNSNIGQQCTIITSTTPGTYENELCSQSLLIDTITCNKRLVPQCSYVASPLTLKEITSNGGITGSLVEGTDEGTYTFRIGNQTTAGCYHDTGTSTITFNLDSIGFGSYININMNSIDDAGAVGVNGIPVWAGYPNSGPAFTYSDLGSPTAATFALGYSWTESSTSPATPAVKDEYGYEITPAQPEGTYTGTFTANTKILDYCPSGYSPLQLSQPSCTVDPNSGWSSCSPNGSATDQYIQGFFCNGNGQFLMNGHEGNDPRSASLGSNFPLVKGKNTIQVFWGTNQGNGKACGQIDVIGTIHNVAPKCSSIWDDGCASPRAATGK